MASTDFDDIFGDLKEDTQLPPSLTYDANNTACDASGGTGSLKAKSSSTSKSVGWHQIGSREQDEFLSWLDEGSPQRNPAPAVGSLGTQERSEVLDFLMDTPTGEAEHSSLLPTPTVSIAALSQPVVASSGNVSIGIGGISLDDDDDDLEKIVQNASRHAHKASGSRENSNSSLQIKSQCSAHWKAQQIDAAAERLQYLKTEVVPAGSRLALWKHAVQPEAQDAASMYAVQTTPRTLPSQMLLRKEVEALCARVFSSAAHAHVLRSVGDTMRGTHLLFIDGAETLLTHLCHHLGIDYSSGLALTFAPVLVASGSDPLRPDLVETLAAACRRFLPHLAQKVSLPSAASGRRLLLKRLLLYHSPRVAFHLDRHFHTWNNAPPDEFGTSSGTEGSGAIPGSWLASFFEGDSIMGDAAGLDFLLKIWDLSLVLEAFSLTSSETPAPLTVTCFVTIYAIICAEKKLLRMEGEQLRHCMASALVEVLLRSGSNPHATTDVKTEASFVQGVRKLMDTTPPSFWQKLRRAGVVGSEPNSGCAGSDVKLTISNSTVESTEAPTNSSSSSGVYSLLSASTQGVMDLSYLMMVDMPVKLFTKGPLSPMAYSPLSPSSSSTTSSTSSPAPPTAQQLFYLHMQALAVSAISMTLAVDEIVPLVFGSFQGRPAPESPTGAAAIRYFVIDCRSEEETHCGQIPTAFHFDPDAVTDPGVLDMVLATLGPLSNTEVHLCVMGHGYAHIAEDLRVFQERQTAGDSSGSSTTVSPFSLSESFLEAHSKDQARVSAAVLFLVQRGFSRVSVLGGGYAAAHGHLFRAHDFTVADLVDHDAPHCQLCQHDRSMNALYGNTNADTYPASGLESVSTQEDHGTAAEVAASISPSVAVSAEMEGESESPAASPTVLPTVGHFPSTGTPASPTASAANSSKRTGSSSYYSSFTGALKSSSKTLLSPTVDGTKWFLKKSVATTAELSSAVIQMGSLGTRSQRVNSTGGPGNPNGEVEVSDSSSPTDRTGSNLNRLRSSLAHIGSESLDMLKKVEHAAVAGTTKTRLSFSSTSPLTASASSPSMVPSPKASPRAVTPLVGSPAQDRGRSDSYDPFQDEVFTIDDDDDDEDAEPMPPEDGSRGSSSSSLRNESFSAAGDHNASALHHVTLGHVHELRKGMSVSRTQLQPFATCPFFACYKKKAVMANSNRPSMQPRRLVVLESHLVVLRAATRSEGDVYMVKSCHPLAHVARMTCLKKNALMVTIYYKFRATNGQVVERTNSYEVQQRDNFIKAIKAAMETMT